MNIKRLFPPIVYRRGLEYYQHGLVSDLLYDINNQIWTATVHGSQDYFVEINMQDYEKGSIDTFCDCPAFDTYDSCKHIVATLISIQYKNKKQPKPTISRYADYGVTNRFMDALRTVPSSQHKTEWLLEKIPLHVEYYMKWTYDEKIVVSLKVGPQRCFVVKDAFAFLKDVLEEKEHEFTKTFTYNPETHYFQQQDLEIFETLYAILRNEQIYNKESLYSIGRMSHDKRYILIPPLALPSLLEDLMERDFTVEDEKKSFSSIQLVRDELPYHFEFTKNEQGEFMLTMHDVSTGTIFKEYNMLFYDGTFYFPSKDQLPIVNQLSGFAYYDTQLPVSKDQADQFLSEVLPSLQKVGEVDIADTIKNEMVQVPLQAKLYLDMKEDWIVGNLTYHYGDEVINPFHDQQQRDQIIIRDVEKEQQIMQLIEQANFHYNGKELYIEASEEELYTFLYEILPVLDKHLEVFLTSEIRHMIVEQEPNPKTSVQLETGSNLLDIGFDISGVKDAEINQILEAVIERKKYYRLQDGALLSLEGEGFSSMQSFFDEMDITKDQLQDGSVQMPVYRGTQVDELIGTKKQYDPAFRRLLHQLEAPEEQVYEIPENLHATLRDYQLTGYQWFKSLSEYHLGGILADDMGLGKTLQSIAYILSEPSQNPHLIVVPSSVVYNWKNEFEKFAPDLRVAVMTGNPVERREKISQSQHIDVWITSYATLRQDIAYYRELLFEIVILDEAQYIKNYATKTSQAIRQIQASRRFALSGTPIENAIDELWAIFQVILPGLMPNQRAFKQLSYEKVAMMTRPFILRRLKQDVLKELPDKIESVQISELTKEQKELYVGYHRQLQQEAAQSIQESGFQQNRMKILAGLTRLRQICCHPSMFMENYEGQSGKLEQLMDTINSALANGKRMLIFSQFTSMHEIIIQKLEKLGIDYFYLHGQTKSQDRVEMSDRFNQGEKNVFLISLKAGGTGLNLTGADTVILYDLWWNPAVEDQAAGRAHRFGQKNVVQVIRLVTEGTIEQKIYDLQQKKRELIDQVIQPGEAMLSSLSEEDVRQLLNI